MRHTSGDSYSSSYVTDSSDEDKKIGLKSSVAVVSRPTKVNRKHLV